MAAVNKWPLNVGGKRQNTSAHYNVLFCAEVWSETMEPHLFLILNSSKGKCPFIYLVGLVGLWRILSRNDQWCDWLREFCLISWGFFVFSLSVIMSSGTNKYFVMPKLIAFFKFVAMVVGGAAAAACLYVCTFQNCLHV